MKSEKDITVAHDYKVGDILVSSWGYEQTNVDFYQVVGITPKCIKIREISGQFKETGYCCGYTIPSPDHFKESIWFGKEKTARVDKYGSVKIHGCSYAHKWDGRPRYTSSYY